MMQEIPETERIFKADLVLIALGFLGPENSLSDKLGVETVSVHFFHTDLKEVILCISSFNNFVPCE